MGASTVKSLHRSLLAFLLLAALATPALAQAPDSPEKRCATPRKAIYTLVYFLSGDRNSPARAAACIDPQGMEHPAVEAPQLASRLKKLLDTRGLEVVFESVPNKPDYENDAGESVWDLFPAELGGVRLERVGERWVFPRATHARISELYRETFPMGMDDMVEAMPDWLRSGFLGVELWQILGILLLVLVAVILQRVILIIFGNYLRRLAARLKVDWIEQAVDRSGKPLGGLAISAVFAVGLPLLQFSVRFNHVAGIATRVLAAFSAVWLAFRLIDVLSDVMAARAEKTETKLDDQLVPLARKTFKIFLAVIGGIFILQNLNVDVGSLIAGLGLGGLAFALAAKDTVANFFGSLMIFVDKPFQIGDWVVIGSDVEGTVEEVGFRTSRVRTFYNSVITVPNARIADSPVDNLGIRQYRRYKTTLGLAYDTPPEKVQAFCEGVRAVIQASPGMRQDYYLVEFQDYGDSSLQILLYCFMVAENWSDELRTRTNLNLEILRLAEALDVEFAFPTQTLHIHRLPDSETSPLPPLPDLAAVVRSFGPGGERARPSGVDLAETYDAEQPIARGDTDDDDSNN